MKGRREEGNEKWRNCELVKRGERAKQRKKKRGRKTKRKGRRKKS